MRAIDPEGNEVVIEASGHEARVIQHEIDHLDGVLILDRAKKAQRRAALRALRRGETYAPPREEGTAVRDEVADPVETD